MIKAFRPGHFTRAQLCEIYGVCKATIIRWEEKGKLPAYVVQRIGGKRVRLYDERLVLAHAAHQGATGHLSKAVKGRVNQMFDAGKSDDEIANAVGIHLAQVASLQKQWSAPASDNEPGVGKAARVVEPEEPDETADAWNASMASAREAAAALQARQVQRLNERRERRREDLGLPPPWRGLSDNTSTTGASKDAPPLSVRTRQMLEILAALHAQIRGET